VGLVGGGVRLSWLKCFRLLGARGNVKKCSWSAERTNGTMEAYFSSTEGPRRQAVSAPVEGTSSALRFGNIR